MTQYDEIEQAMQKMSIAQRMDFVRSIPDFFPEMIGATDAECRDYCSDYDRTQPVRRANSLLIASAAYMGVVIALCIIFG